MLAIANFYLLLVNTLKFQHKLLMFFYPNYFFLLFVSLIIRTSGFLSFSYRNFNQQHAVKNNFDEKQLILSVSNDLDHSEGKKPTTIAIVGSGAVGSYYGARLHEVSHYNVTFLARGEHFKVCTENGLDIKSVDGDFSIPKEELNMVDSIDNIGACDWILICLKSTSIQDAPKLILPLLKKDRSTRVLLTMNGLVDDDFVQSLIQSNDKYNPENISDNPNNGLPCAAVYGGMAFICSNRLEPGKIEHSFFGNLNAGLAATSTSQIPFQLKNQDMFFDEHMLSIENLWKPTKVTFTGEPSLVTARWTKNLWNLPFNGISVSLQGLTTDIIATDESLRKLANKIMDDTICVAKSDIKAREGKDDGIDWEALRAFMWDLTDNMGPYKTSTMLDFKAKRPMEIHYLFRKALDRAHDLKCDVPYLETIVLQLEALEKLYK